MYDIEDVVEYILYRSEKNKNIMSNLKLQKVLYFIQAEFLLYFGYRCFREEITAWDIGPVILPVYRKYAIYGMAHIPILRINENRKFPFSEEECWRLNDMIDTLAPYSASELTEITMCQDPWKDAVCRKDKLITNESLIKFFRGTND